MAVINLKTGDPVEGEAVSVETAQAGQGGPSMTEATIETPRMQGRVIDLDTGDPVEQEGVQDTRRGQVDFDEFRKQIYQAKAKGYSPLEALGISLGRGLQTVGQGLGVLEDAPETQVQAYKAVEEEYPMITAGGEIGGETLPFIPLAVATGGIGPISGRIAASTLIGGTEGGAIASGKGQDVGSGTMVGATVGGVSEAVLPVVGRLISRLYRRVKGSAPSAPLMDAQGQPTAETQEILRRSGLSLDDIGVEAQRLMSTGSADPAAVARRSFLESQGIIPTRAQVTGDAADFQAQQELAKTSGRVRRALEGQEGELLNRFENAITQTGGSANRSNSSAVDYIADRAINLDAEISNAYRQAREAAPTGRVVAPTGLINEVRQIRGSDRSTGGLAGSVRDILRRNDVIEGNRLEVSNRVTPEAAEQIRIEMNTLHDSLTPFGRRRLRDLKNALDDDVAGSVGEEIFADARAAKAQFERDLNRVKVNKFDTRKKELVRDILENKINPDRFLDDAILSRSVRGSDVKQLRDYLLLDGSEAGTAAWNDIRAEAMERIQDTAFREVGGEAALSRAGIERAIERFGPQKLEVLFTPEERRFLGDMATVSRLREPKRGTALGRGPSAQAIGRLEDTIKRIPLLGGIYEGLTIDAQGRLILRPPSVDPLRALPGPASAAVPAGVAVSVQETQETED